MTSAVGAPGLTEFLTPFGRVVRPLLADSIYLSRVLRIIRGTVGGGRGIQVAGAWPVTSLKSPASWGANPVSR